MVVCDSYQDLYMCRITENLELIAAALYVIIALTALTVITVLLYVCGCIKLRCRHGSSRDLYKPSLKFDNNPAQFESKPSKSVGSRQSSDVENPKSSPGGEVFTNPSAVAVNMAYTPDTDGGDLPASTSPPVTTSGVEVSVTSSMGHRSSAPQPVTSHPTGAGGISSYRGGGPGSTVSSTASSSGVTSTAHRSSSTGRHGVTSNHHHQSPSTPTYQHPAKPGTSGLQSRAKSSTSPVHTSKHHQTNSMV